MSQRQENIKRVEETISPILMDFCEQATCCPDLIDTKLYNTYLNDFATAIVDSLPELGWVQKSDLPEKRKLTKDSPYLDYDKGFNHCLAQIEWGKK